jgi:hypothetical protein
MKLSLAQALIIHEIGEDAQSGRRWRHHLGSARRVRYRLPTRKGSNDVDGIQVDGIQQALSDADLDGYLLCATG